MTKKLLAVMIIVLLGLCMLSACGKKDDTETDTQMQQEQIADSHDQQAAQTTDEDANDQKQPEEQADTEMDQLEQLVETFNNPESQEQKEQARLKLETILKQAQQQQQ